MTESVNPSRLATLMPYAGWGGSPAESAGPNVVPSWDFVQPAFSGAAPRATSAQSSWLGGIGSGISGIINSFGSVMNNFIALINNQLNALGGGSGSQATPQAGPEQFVSTATLTDWGDPHLSATATTDAGQAIGSSWDSMDAHANLLSSDSFDGGFQIATAVTDPNAQGVTLNSSADVHTQNGNVDVELGGSGAQISEYGRTIAMQAGQSYALGNDEVVTENANGSLVIDQSNANGGTIATTLSLNGAGGVDVNASASNVDLGGYLLTHADEPGAIG
jgi:hypothetical protein